MKKKMIFIIGGLVLVAGGMGGAYSLGLFGNSAELEAASAEQAIVEEPAPLFYNLPALVVSSNYNGSLRYLQVKMSILTRNEETRSRLEHNTPLIQDSLIMLLDSFSFHQLENPEGKEMLRVQAETEVRRLIADERVESVLFTGFVIQ